MMALINWLIDKALYAVIGFFITIQGFVVWADMMLPTGPFDELAGMAITAAMGWIMIRIKKRAVPRPTIG